MRKPMQEIRDRYEKVKEQGGPMGMVYDAAGMLLECWEQGTNQPGTPEEEDTIWNGEETVLLIKSIIPLLELLELWASQEGT